MRRGKSILVLGLTFFLLETAGGHPPQEEEGEFIRERFQAAIGTIPQMAWVLPEGSVAAPGQSESIFLFSRSPRLVKAKLHKTMSPAQSRQFALQHNIACDVAPEDSAALSVYHYNPRPSGPVSERTLFTRKPLPGLQGGFQRVALSAVANKEVWGAMLPDASTVERSAIAIRQKRGFPYFSFAAVYDQQHLLARMGMFLHSSDGKILASQIEEVREENWCDGCALPDFPAGIEAVYRIENMFASPQFPYPLVLLDTSTVEGRAVSLVTVTPDGEFDSFRLYEYVVGCGGNPQ